MGRAKIEMKFIGSEKKRNKAYEKRKSGLIKKASEFSTLCNVPVCMIIYSYKEGNQLSQPDVYSFKEGEQAQICGLNNNPKLVRSSTDTKTVHQMIGKYLDVPKEERCKNRRERNLCDMLDERYARANQELSKMRRKNAMAKYPTSDSIISGFSGDQMVEMIVHLDQKIELVSQKIAMFKVANQLEFNHWFSFVEPPMPISGLMSIPHANYPQMGVFNHPMLPFDLNSSYNLGDQLTGPVEVDQRSNDNYLQSMNMGGPIFYDQGPGLSDNVLLGPSYSPDVGCPFSMPLHLPLQPNNMPLPRFYR